MSLIRRLLFALPALLYWIGLTIDRAWRSGRPQTLPRPVISIGNITLGGTGKTPLLIRAYADLKKLGIRPAILTRGYRGMGAGAGKGDSDEVALMRSRCAGVLIGIGADRVQQAQRFMDSNTPDVFLLDDGFQHWPITRGLDIVCIDATDPWGGGALVPAGRLREPTSALKRATAIVVTRTELVSSDRLTELKGALEQKSPSAAVLVTRFQSTLIDARLGAAVADDVLAMTNALAVSALGNPGAFEESVRRFGAVVTPRRYPDHYAYTLSDWAEIHAQAAAMNGVIVTTEKDWMKLRALSLPEAARPVYVSRLETVFEPGDEARWTDLLRSSLS